MHSFYSHGGFCTGHRALGALPWLGYAGVRIQLALFVSFAHAPYNKRSHSLLLRGLLMADSPCRKISRLGFTPLSSVSNLHPAVALSYGQETSYVSLLRAVGILGAFVPAACIWISQTEKGRSLRFQHEKSY